MYTTPRVALAMFMAFVGVVRGLWGSKKVKRIRRFSETQRFPKQRIQVRMLTSTLLNIYLRLLVKNLLMPLFLRKGRFPVDFQEVKRPLRTKSVKRPIKVGKRPINE